MATFSFLRTGGFNGLWEGSSEAEFRRIHGPFEIVFVSIRQRFRTVQKDIGQLRKGLEPYYE